jgi:hypothetical protein
VTYKILKEKERTSLSLLSRIQEDLDPEEKAWCAPACNRPIGAAVKGTCEEAKANSQDYPTRSAKTVNPN